MTSYRDAGVDINAKMTTIEQLGPAIRATHTPAVLAGLGAFGGCFDLSAVNAACERPVLVASTDGIGTKTLVAEAVGDYSQLGYDLVHHCINDIACQGATPLFFMDYIAAARLAPELVVAVVQGIAAACAAAGVALLGGETAEMPGVYQQSSFDVAGTLVGVVDHAQLLDGRAIAPGDAVLALPSSGLHTNGYSLARKVAAPAGYAATPPELNGRSVGAALLEPHRSYAPALRTLRETSVAIHGLAHITGGGLWDNPPRVLPTTVRAEIVRGSWPVPPICTWVAAQAGLDEHAAFHALNMGLGMLVIVPASAVAAAQTALPEICHIGRIVVRQPQDDQVALVDH